MSICVSIFACRVCPCFRRPARWDVILTSYGGHANHAALYLGDGQILHHAYNQLSRREPFNQWWSERIDGVWRLPEFEPEMLQAVENDLLHSVDL
ncbi:NlpC/P60 family protein [Neisseria subflava]|uniref:NlpC/P60 family protein n=1 Tax=Neisseria subflava TaxID=28449 RepID=UPI002029CA2C|nr:NlpC/P60 family protein [Neisseria subflava]